MWKSAHGQSTLKVCQRGGVCSFECCHKRAPMSCLQQLNALEVINWTNNDVQWSHQWLQSQHTTLETGLSPWARGAQRISYVRRYCVVTFKEVSCLRYAWRLWSCFSNSMSALREAHSKVGTHLSKLWFYAGNWAKSREWVLFHETTVYTLVVRYYSCRWHFSPTVQVFTPYPVCWPYEYGAVLSCWGQWSVGTCRGRDECQGETLVAWFFFTVFKYWRGSYVRLEVGGQTSVSWLGWYIQDHCSCNI